MGLDKFSGGGTGTGDATEAKQDTAQTAIDKIPKSDGTVSFNATALAAIEAEVEDALQAMELDHLSDVTDGANNYPNTVLAGSVLAKIISKAAAGATPTGYNNTTDSLEAIADAVAAIPTTAMRGTDNAALASVLGALDSAASTTVNTTTTEVAYTKGLLNEVAKIPKSDSTVTFNATALASVNAEVDTALNTIVPASPTAGSLNDILSKASGGNTFNKATDSLESIGEDTDALIAANPAVLATGTLTTSSTTVPADTGRGEATNYWNGCILIPLTGDAALQPRKIASFSSTGDVFTLETPFTAAPGTVAYVIVPATAGSRTDYKDIWCTAQLNNVTITTAGADKDFPDVVVAAQGSARGLPLGAVCTEAYLLMMFDLLDTSTAANYIKTAGDDIRVMIDGQAWTNAPIAWTSVAGDWYTPASGMSSQVIIGAANVLLATYGVTTTGVGTYHVGSDETAASKAIESQGATLALKNLRTGLRLYYRMP